MPHAAAAGSPAVVGVAGGVGTSTVAVALGGLDLGVFTGRPADVVVCRATVASVLRAGRVAALCGRPVVAVTAVDTGKPSSALRSRLALLEPVNLAILRNTVLTRPDGTGARPGIATLRARARKPERVLSALAS